MTKQKRKRQPHPWWHPNTRIDRVVELPVDEVLKRLKAFNDYQYGYFNHQRFSVKILENKSESFYKLALGDSSGNKGFLEFTLYLNSLSEGATHIFGEIEGLRSVWVTLLAIFFFFGPLAVALYGLFLMDINKFRRTLNAALDLENKKEKA